MRAAIIRGGSRLLRTRAPAAYRALRPIWRALRAAAFGPGYWEGRKDFAYYRQVERLAREHVPSGGRVIDVGSNDTEVLGRFSWFSERVALDAVPISDLGAGITVVTSDFMTYRTERPFDLVICLQVLEHVPDPAAFGRKLLATGAVVIVSVPYRWPPGAERGHIHDPIDDGKLAGWMERQPTVATIVTDERPRLVAVYA